MSTSGQVRPSDATTPFMSGFPQVTAFAPGRTELAGNHTDHQGGHVLSATVLLGIRAWAAENGSDFIRVESAGFAPCAVDLAGNLAPRPGERNTSAALVRGMAACFREAGIAVRGFDLRVESTLPAGGGLSSSAAFELLVGQVLNRLFAQGCIDAATLARWGCRVENDWFGKACGLQDQTIVANGGIQLMDFSQPVPTLHPLAFDFERAGYAVVLVDAHCDHSAATSDFSQIPADMQAVARALGADLLGRADAADFFAQVPALRMRLGDKAVLRALHYFQEDERVLQRAAALEAGDIDRFLRLANASGRSSAQYLQNVSTGGDSQPAMVALALADRLLEGSGAFRIHGGGFGGSIQAYVPLAMVDGFCRQMDAWLGAGSCLRLKLGGPGAWAAGK